MKIFPLALYVKEFRVPEGVRVIGEYAFRNNKNIQNIVLPETITKIETSAFNRTAIRSINLPSSITEIEMFAFANCKYLESILLPNGIEELSSYVFSGCEQLEYIQIPISVRKIDDNALAGCKSLSEIHCNIENIKGLDVDYSTYSSKYTSFENMNPSCTWRVPRGTAEAYKSQPWWVSTWRIVEDNAITLAMEGNWQTFCSDYNLDFSDVSGLEAYIITEFDQPNGKAVAQRVTKVPAGQGVLLKGIPGYYTIPITDEVSWNYTNLLVGVVNDTELTSGYVLDSQSGDDTFVGVSGSQTLKAGEAYLNLAGVSAPQRITTGMESLRVDVTSDSWYTPQGIRLNAKPTKPGLYIINGKKVMIK